MVRAVLHRNGRSGMGASDRSRYHGFRYRPQQRGLREGVFDGREHDDRREYLRHSWAHWNWRSGSIEFGPPCPDVFVLKI